MAEKRVSVRLVAEGGRQVRAELEGMKNITVCENVVTIRSAANAAAEAQMDALADEIVAK